MGRAPPRPFDAPREQPVSDIAPHQQPLLPPVREFERASPPNLPGCGDRGNPGDSPYAPLVNPLGKMQPDLDDSPLPQWSCHESNVAKTDPWSPLQGSPDPASSAGEDRLRTRVDAKVVAADSTDRRATRRSARSRYGGRAVGTASDPRGITEIRTTPRQGRDRAVSFARARVPYALVPRRVRPPRAPHCGRTALWLRPTRHCR